MPPGMDIRCIKSSRFGIILNNRRQYLIVGLIAVANALLHLLPGVHFEYHRDELLYFSLCNHLDFGYATTPPFVGLVAFISKSIFGYSVFAVRFFPAVTSGLLVILTALMAKELNGNFRSQLISALGVTGSMLLVLLYGIFTPYFFDVFFWTLIILLVIKYVKTNEGKYLVYSGIVIGLSILNKYNVLFLLTAILFVIPFTRHRSVFGTKHFYYGMFLAALIALPNIIWQAVHNFPVIGHMKELKETQLVNVSRIEFIVEQLVYLLPYSFVILPGIVFFVVGKQLREYRFLLAISGVVFLMLLVLNGKSFYASGFFPFLIVVGALFVEKCVVNRYWFSAVLIVLVLFSASMLPMALPVLKPDQMVVYYERFAGVTGIDLLRKDEDGKYRKLPQINADMLGWSEMTEIVNKGWIGVEHKERSFIFCANYGQAGAISVIGKRFGLPEPVSFSDSYRLWLPRKFQNEIDELIYVIGEDALGSGNFEDTKAFFEQITEVGRVSNPYAIEYNTRVYLFSKPKGNFNDFWKGQIKGY